MSLENLNLNKATAKDVVTALGKEISRYSLPQAVRRVLFSEPRSKVDRVGFRGTFPATDEIPWVSFWETWKSGGRVTNAYPWAFSVTRTDGENNVYLVKRDKGFVFSGKMPILDFNKMLGEIISEKGSGVSPVRAEDVARGLTEDIAVNQESVDFSKINVSFEFKFGMENYKVVRVEVL